MHTLRLMMVTMVAAPVSPLAQGPQPATAAPVAEKKVCRRAAPTTGSMMPGKRTCHTAAEWLVVDAKDAADSRTRPGDRFMTDPAMSNIPTGGTRN